MKVNCWDCQRPMELVVTMVMSTVSIQSVALRCACGAVESVVPTRLKVVA